MQGIYNRRTGIRREHAAGQGGLRRGRGLVIHVFFFFAALAGVFWLCAGESPANSPAAAGWIVISPENVPEEAVFLELLIPMSQEDPHYRSFNQSGANETGLTSSAPIVGYMDEGGYISYTFHMENAVSKLKLEKRDGEQDGCYPCRFGEGAFAGSQSHLEYIQRNFKTIKAALLDAEGNILAISHAASIDPGRSGYLSGSIMYDCETGQLSPGFYEGNTLGIILMIGMVLLAVPFTLAVRALFSSTVESAVSLAFGIRPRSTVFMVNIISNLTFNLLLILCTGLFRIPYLVFVTAGEIVAAAAEYSIYCRVLKSFSRTRLMAFSVTANLASLVLGLGLNHMLSRAGIDGISRLL